LVRTFTGCGKGANAKKSFGEKVISQKPEKGQWKHNLDLNDTRRLFPASEGNAGPSKAKE
jgi:hypothetical protein